MHPYRVKITIHVSGQPLFDAALDHHEQARCRECGHIIRASGPEREGLGSDYIRYDWSACAMLMMMHYFAGAPFKRLESLHASWGIPLPDANQWEVVSAADDLLLPLYRAIERHAIERATAFRVDDTGSMVISLKKEIEAEIAALERLGKSAKDVRTGINATGFYWETAADAILRGPGGPARHEPRRASAHHPGPLSLGVVQLPDGRRSPGRRPRHVLDCHGARQRNRARRVPHRMPPLPRGSRGAARTLLALGVSQANTSAERGR
jgi:hypothetical protein